MSDAHPPPDPTGGRARPSAAGRACHGAGRAAAGAAYLGEERREAQRGLVARLRLQADWRGRRARGHGEMGERATPQIRG